MKRLTPLEGAWLLLESRDTPMHVGALYEFTRPADAGPNYLQDMLAGMRAQMDIPQPWNLRLVDGPLVGHKLPLLREDHDIDLDYHLRHSALPEPGGQRELGVLISRLHSYQLDLYRPLWEFHLIEGLEGGERFAIYLKMHHSLIDGVSGIRMAMRTMSSDPDDREMPAFWTIGEGSKPPHSESEGEGTGANALASIAGAAGGGLGALAALGRAGAALGIATFEDRPLSAPYSAPDSALGGQLGGQRRFATQQYDLERLKGLAATAGCTLNDLVLYLSSTAIRRYLTEHGKLPGRSLTGGVPVNLREAGDESTGTEIGFLVAELATNVADPAERLATIAASTAQAKEHQQRLPKAARTPYTLLLQGPYMAGLMAGLGGRAPIPFNLAISNVPGPSEPLYFNGARLEAMAPVSLLTHGNALNITCLSYAGTLNFGLTGARDTLPHLQRLAVYMGEGLEEIDAVLSGTAGTDRKRRRKGKASKAKSNTTKRGSGKASA